MQLGISFRMVHLRCQAALVLISEKNPWRLTRIYNWLSVVRTNPKARDHDLTGLLADNLREEAKALCL